MKVKKMKKKVSKNGIKPVKETMNKSALIQNLAEAVSENVKGVDGKEMKVAKVVFQALENLMLGSVTQGGVGEFMLPGLFKVTLRKIPARKAGVLVRNPATGEMIKGKAKPSSVRVKIRALSKLKKAAI